MPRGRRPGHAPARPAAPPRPAAALLAACILAAGVVVAGSQGPAAAVVVAGSQGPAAARAPDDLPRPERSAAEVRRVTEEVLARPELRPPVRSIQERILEFVLRQVERALEALVGGGRGSFVGWAVLVASLAALVLFSVRLVRGTGSGRRVRGPGSEPRRPAADWRAEAEGHEAREEWKEALRCRYRELVADLAARGLVEEVPGRTTGEYLAEVGISLPAASEQFASATRLFELAWYGNRRTGREENLRFRSMAAAVLDRAGAAGDGGRPPGSAPDAPVAVAGGRLP